MMSRRPHRMSGWVMTAMPPDCRRAAASTSIRPRGQHQRRTLELLRDRMVALEHPARDLKVEKPVAHAIAPDQSRASRLSAPRGPSASPSGFRAPNARGGRDALPRRGCALQDREDFVDEIAELKPAILDMHAGFAVRNVAAVHIGARPGGARCGQRLDAGADMISVFRAANPEYR